MSLNMPFVPGLDLAEGFFREAVGPIVDAVIPGLEYSAALIGRGSEVFGFDTEMSADHDWGPRAMLFLRPGDLEIHGTKLSAVLGERLPLSYRGYPTNWSQPDAGDNGTQCLCPTKAYPINHRVEILSIKGFLGHYLGVDVDAGLSAADWLTLPHQKLRSLCAGRVFRDDLGLKSVRHRFSWYPHDVWLYVLASCWSRIDQEEPLTGRAGSAGDRVGSAIIAWRLAREIMRLAFMMQRVYPPYAKWFGAAFRQLRCASALEPVLGELLGAPTWVERDRILAVAYRHLAEMHNALGITPPLSCEPMPFWGRPFTVIRGERFAKALRDAIRDPAVKSMAHKSLIGSVDLISDNTDLLEDTGRRRALLALYA